MLSVTRPSGGLPSAETHPTAVNALLRAKDAFLFGVYMIYTTISLVILLALLYDNGPGVRAAQVVIWALVFVFFFGVGVVYFRLQVHRSHGPTTCSQDVRMGLVDPDLEFSSTCRLWRWTVVSEYGGVVGWLFAATALTVHVLVLVAHVRWRAKLLASDRELGPTPINMFAVPILIAGITLCSVNMARTVCSMAMAALWALWQWNTPDYERIEKRSWSGLWHIGSYLL